MIVDSKNKKQLWKCGHDVYIIFFFLEEKYGKIQGNESETTQYILPVEQVR